MTFCFLKKCVEKVPFCNSGHIVGRNHGGLHIHTQKIVILMRNQPYVTFMVPWQYWLGVVKLKSAFSVTT